MSSSSSVDEEPVVKRQRGSYSVFDEEMFVDGILKRKKEKQRCCGRTCLLKLKESAVRTHAQLLTFYFSLNPPDLRNRVFRTFVMTCYMQQMNEHGNHCEYRVPAIKHKLCRETWLMLMNISKGTYDNWRSLTVPRRDVLPPDHGLASYASNAAKPAARAAVRQYVEDIAAGDGHPLPVRMRRSDGKHTDSMDGTETIVVLPPRYTKRSLHKEYIWS